MKNDFTLGEKLLVTAGVFAAFGVIILSLNFIPFLLWNKCVAPAFGWRHFGFWQVFGICWLMSWVGKLVFGGGKSK